MKNIKIALVLSFFISNVVSASCIDFNPQNGECINWEDNQEQTEVAMNYGNDYQDGLAQEPDYNSDACRERGECY